MLRIEPFGNRLMLDVHHGGEVEMPGDLTNQDDGQDASGGPKHSIAAATGFDEQAQYNNPRQAIVPQRHLLGDKALFHAADQIRPDRNHDHSVEAQASPPQSPNQKQDECPGRAAHHCQWSRRGTG